MIFNEREMKKYLACLLLLTSLSTKIYGHNPFRDLMWTTINTFGLYDSNNNKYLPSFDINTSLLCINGGLGYKNIKYTDSKKMSFYVGLGIGSFIQLQAGFSKDGFSIRNRYDLQIGYLFRQQEPGVYHKPRFFGNITISPAIEKYFNNPHMNWFFGIGIGLSINNENGLIHF